MRFSRGNQGDKRCDVACLYQGYLQEVHILASGQGSFSAPSNRQRRAGFARERKEISIVLQGGSSGR